jgi:hypothetical protein
MALGRKTGGRKKGTPNKKTKELQYRIETSGLTPLDYLLRVMRDPEAGEHERLDAAKSAAPYVHPRLSTIEHGSKDGNPAGVGGQIKIVLVDPPDRK